MPISGETIDMRMTIFWVGAALLFLDALPAGAQQRDVSRSKDPCDQICRFVKPACEKECKKQKDKERSACLVECPGATARCKQDCPRMIRGQKTKEQIDAQRLADEQRAQRRAVPGADKPPPLTTEPAPSAATRKWTVPPPPQENDSDRQ